jgi:hypothetical protein
MIDTACTPCPYGQATDGRAEGSEVADMRNNPMQSSRCGARTMSFEAVQAELQQAWHDQVGRKDLSMILGVSERPGWPPPRRCHHGGDDRLEAFANC